jgi:DNA helicase II / ATP-dependent DNA helicase PcrA
MTDLSQDKLKLLETDGHVLALGGPGSGKTYIALMKADKIIAGGRLLPRQRVLFLSFARATIARVAQQAGKLISQSERSGLEINTYHGFAWRILQSHAYLLNAAQKIRVIPPPEAAASLATIDIGSRAEEKRRLFEQEGVLHFDLFAQVCRELLSRSRALLRILCDTYPVIILDEFQDTNDDEWQMIKTLGEKSILIALADAEQRIYEFRGADPKRIGEFISKYSPAQFDFGSENNRSNGTDIVAFGNDLLAGSNKGKTYESVTVLKYQILKGTGIHLDLKLTVMKRCVQLRESSSGEWSLAILVPTKQLMIDVSDYLGSEQLFVTGKRLGPLSHDVALDTEGPALAAVLIAGLLEGGGRPELISHRLILDLCEHVRGRKGNQAPSRSQLELANALTNYLGSGVIRGPKRQSLVAECQQSAATRAATRLSGDPGEDWLLVRRQLQTAAAEVLQQVAEDAKYLRLLHRGALLRSRLSELWRTTGCYHGAVAAVREALLQEHFSASTKVWQGVHVMTIHKSKGKEFDEVIIYEGSHQGRIVRMNASDKDIAQARLALRVAVTRAMKHATILSPRHDVCRFL